MSVNCWTANFCIHVSKGPVITLNQLNVFALAHPKIPIHTPFTSVFRLLPAMSLNFGPFAPELKKNGNVLGTLI